MKNDFAKCAAFAAAAMSVTLAAFAAVSPAMLESFKAIDACRKPLDARKAPYVEVFDALEKLRAEPLFATNAEVAANLDRQLINLCHTPNWVGLKRWDTALVDRIPAVARRNIESKALPMTQKVFFAIDLATYLAGEKRFDEAEQLLADLRRAAKRYDAVVLTLALADVYRWQDRFDEAKREIVSASAVLPDAAAKKAIMTRDDKFIAEVLAKIPTVDQRLMVCREMKYETPALRKAAYDFVAGLQGCRVEGSSANPSEARATVAVHWLAEDYSPEAEAALRALASADTSKANVGRFLNMALDSVFVRGDWKRVKLLADAFKGQKILAEPRQQRKIIVATAGLGDRDAALALVRRHLKGEDGNLAAKNAKMRNEEKMRPLDLAKYRALEALLANGDIDEVVREAKLDHKDEIELVRTVARQALTLNFADEAEKLSAKYRSYFVDYPQRELKVAFSSRTIDSIADWRKIAATLDRQSCDRKFGANLDILDTDVATGRQAVEATERDTKDVRMEVSSVCDTRGIHFFLCVADPNARQVEAGFAGGLGTEMYFSTGLYQPYVCFGSDPRTGVNSEFHTTYTNLGYRRPKVKSEAAFTDKDYILHVWIAWEDLYWNLPKDGSRYRFECITWGATPFSLGGSEGVHNPSKWCDLVFALAPADVTAIRRALLYRGVRSWRHVDFLRELDLFDKWADREVGDPAFYGEVLKPVEDALMADAARVKPEMSDAEVNEIFERSYVRWMGIRHEVDALRREWLEERIFE